MHKFELYCKDYENVENYEKAKVDNFEGWCCHHRRETHTPDGNRREVDISREELKALEMYYDRPAEELIFLTSSEHQSLHNKGKQYYKGKHHSDESKKKMSEAHKGNTNTKGMRWYHNDVENIMAKECPEGFFPGMLKRK